MAEQTLTTDSAEDAADCGSNHEPPVKPYRLEIRPALEPTCCGSGCADCPF